MKNDVDLIERGRDDFAIAQIAFDKLHFWIDPIRFAAFVRVRLQIVEHANIPTIAHEQIGDVRSNESSAARHERTYCHSLVVAAVYDRRKPSARPWQTSAGAAPTLQLSLPD